MAQAQRTGNQLIQAVREAANEESPNPTSAFVTDIEILRRIVEAQYALYDLMLAADPSLFATSANFTLTSSNVYPLASLPDPGWYRTLGVEYANGGTGKVDVPRFSFSERNRVGYVAYSVQGTNLVFYPTNNFARTYTIWYTPRIAELTAAGTLDVFTDNYQTYLIASAAAAVMAKAEESDPSSMLATKAAEELRILGALVARHAEPEQVARRDGGTSSPGSEWS